MALWLRLSDTEVPCVDPGCAAREMYLTSDGSGRVPTSGPLPAFARRDGFGYFEYKRHPHHDKWAADVDPVSVQWMSTVLALYGGYMRINWFGMGGADPMAAGYSLWEVSAHQVREISRWTAVAGTDGAVTRCRPTRAPRPSSRSRPRSRPSSRRPRQPAADTPSPAGGASRVKDSGQGRAPGGPLRHYGAG